MSAWRPLARISWREACECRLRSGAAVLLIALPVGAGVIAAEISHNTLGGGEQGAREEMGAADAIVTVTPYPSVRLGYSLGTSLRARPTAFEGRGRGRHAVRRDPRAVDIGRELPEGSVTIAAPQYGSTPLPSGGTALVLSVDASSPLIDGIVAIDAGRAPAGPSEAAVSAPIADILGLFDDDGRLRDDAELILGSGRLLHVVGLMGDNDAFGATSGAARILVTPSSGLLTDRTPPAYLADFPASAPPTPALVSSLATRGLAVMPRDIYFHPAAWDAGQSSPDAADPRSLKIGVVVGVAGMLEAVVVVASVFTVSVRRRLRRLGNLAAIGASPADLRRVLLLQGVIFGCGGAGVGVALGLIGFRAVLPAYEDMSNHTVWTDRIDLSAALSIAALGALSGIVACLLPARLLGTASVLETITGVSSAPPRRRRWTALALMVVVAGTSLLGVSFVWHARTASQPVADSTAPSLCAAVGLLLVVVGAGGLVPRAVRSLWNSGRGLPFSSRYALRTLGRNVTRTSTAVIALMTVVGIAVLASFSLESTASEQAADPTTPVHGTRVSVPAGVPGSPPEVARIEATMQTVFGSVRLQHVSNDAHGPNAPRFGRTLIFVASRTVTSDDLSDLAAYGLGFPMSRDVQDRYLASIRLAATGALALVVLIVVALVVGLAAAEGRREFQLLAAVGAGPWRARLLGSVQGLLIGLLGASIGALLGLGAGAALQAVGDSSPAVVPWADAGVALLAVSIVAGIAGALGSGPSSMPRLRPDLRRN
jgi:putative ABC transport system permease protein